MLVTMVVATMAVVAVDMTAEVAAATTAVEAAIEL